MNKVTAILWGFAITASATIIATIAAPGLNQPHDWTMELKTRQMPLQFEYQGSTLKPVVKTELKFYHVGQEENKTLYEYLWYANEKTLGLERKAKLTIAPGENVAIIVSHESESPPESEVVAAAKAVMNAVLDIEVNQSMVATIKVPTSSFNTICSEIEQYNFHPGSSNPNEEVNSDLCLFVESEAGEKKSLYHYN